MPVKKDDAHRALEMLENYSASLNAPQDRQLRMAIEKLIHIFKSNLFKALLDIQEFYELILMDDSTDVNTKSLAVLKIAEKWSESPPLPTAKQVDKQIISELDALNINGGSKHASSSNIPAALIGKKKVQLSATARRIPIDEKIRRV